MKSHQKLWNLIKIFNIFVVLDSPDQIPRCIIRLFLLSVWIVLNMTLKTSKSFFIHKTTIKIQTFTTNCDQGSNVRMYTWKHAANYTIIKMQVRNKMLFNSVVKRELRFDYRCQVLKLMTVKPQWESQLQKYSAGKWGKSKTLDFTKGVNKHQRKKKLPLPGDQETSQCWFWGHPENRRSKTVWKKTNSRDRKKF